jgi:hypothetical protein
MMTETNGTPGRNSASFQFNPDDISTGIGFDPIEPSGT